MSVAVTRSGYLESLRALGIDVIVIEKEGELWNRVRDIIKKCKALIIEEDLYKSIDFKLRRTLQGLRYPPLLIIVPNAGRERTTRLKDMYEFLSAAVGVKLKVSMHGSSSD